jgi:hypothetical protein
MAIRGNRIRNWVFNIIDAAVPAAVTAIGMVAIATLLLNTIGVTRGPSLDDASDWIYFVVVTCGSTALFAVVTIRALARSVDVSEAGLMARYAFRTKRIPWADINGFQMRILQDDEGPDRYKVQYERCDGQRRSLPIGTWSSKAAAKATRWLNEQRRVLDHSKA